MQDHPNVKIIRYKHSLSELMGEKLCDESSTWFELAWAGVYGSERNTPEQLTVNIPLVISSVSLAAANGVKSWVGIGSQAEYGNRDKRIDEQEVCLPTTLYGKSKLWCSQISQELCNHHNIGYSWLRLFSVYGPDDTHDWLIQYLIKKMLSNEDVDVTKAEQFWDYLYIDDVTEVMLSLYRQGPVGIANLGSGKAVQVKWIIEKIKELSGSSSSIHFGTVPYREDQVMFMEASNDKLKSKLQWQPVTPMEEGLLNTIQFLKKNHA